MINGEYAYVATDYFPYIMGCFGPGEEDSLKYKVSCSGNLKSADCQEGKSLLEELLELIANNAAAIAIGVVVAVILIGGAFWYFKKKDAPDVEENQGSKDNEQNQTQMSNVPLQQPGMMVPPQQPMGYGGMGMQGMTTTTTTTTQQQ